MDEQTVHLPDTEPQQQPDELRNELRQLFYLYFQNCSPEERAKIQQNMDGLSKPT